MIALTIARVYSKLFRVLRPNGRIPGIGILLRQIHTDQIIRVDGLQFFLGHAIAGCYPTLISGHFEEPETHLFLGRLVDLLATAGNGPVTLLDVGANVGEVTVDLARHSAVTRVMAFEPIAECARACSVTAALNSLDAKVVTRRVAIGSKPGYAHFHFNKRSPQASGLTTNSNDGIVQVSTLDVEAANIDGACVLKIDVEGAELEVLRGGNQFINNVRPLIVFEYTQSTRSFYSLDDVRNILGGDYQLFRLRGDGLLDGRLEQTWNVVAISKDSVFTSIGEQLLATDGEAG